MIRTKGIWAAVLAAAVAVSATACSGDDTKKVENSTAESTSTSAEKTTTSTEATTTSATTTKVAETDIPVTDVNDAESVTVHYGWDMDDTDYIAKVYCPEGAKFNDYTLDTQAADGWVLTADITDEVNEYSATSVSHWHRDAYVGEIFGYPIIAQLYFDGELDADTASDYHDCSQKVTPLGYKWNGYDVILIETKYAYQDYFEQTDRFVGVEYDLNYWKVNEDTGETNDLTTKGLFGFDMYSYSMDELTQEKCAWIGGELFGVDTGIANPFTDIAEEVDTVPVDIDEFYLIGKWVNRESAWEDTYFFDYGGYGSYTSGFESTFTYSVVGNTLTVFYAEDDIDIFTVTVEEDALLLVDEYEYEQRFEKVAEETEVETETEDNSSTEQHINTNVANIIGTWTESETGYNETFTFNADGTGWYSCLSEDGTYECSFTYEFFSSDYVDIYYSDGDVGGFLIAIDGDVLTVRNEYVTDLAYSRQ
ncbi:MAG: hypothetical protein E7478_09805 [Ruminococcaceae bacterium]|nr:hypothetical protein [Oscillospiraceae bacterium]